MEKFPWNIRLQFCWTKGSNSLLHLWFLFFVTIPLSHRGVRTTQVLFYFLLPRPRYIGGRGIVFDRFLCIFLSSYLCVFVSKITRKRLDRFARNFQGRCGVTVGRPDSILGQIGETARCRDAYFFCIICQHYEQTAGLICMTLWGKAWSDHGITWLHFWSIPRNRVMPQCATRGRGLLYFRTTACLLSLPWLLLEVLVLFYAASFAW